MKYLFVLLLTVFILPSVSHGNSRAADTLPVLNREAPAFELKDSKGMTVSLASLKGKVVVLDFWATWCVPCHQSFPAMQKAVSHYEKNEDVVFLFVDTREKSADYERLAKEDMSKHHYDFNVIFDEKGDDGRQGKYYKLYDMIGIPTKFIIDRNGIIRYKLEGYAVGKTDDENANELVTLIEKAKTM